MIRQLLDTNGSQDDIEVILNTISQDGESNPNMNNDDISETSASSHSVSIILDQHRSHHQPTYCPTSSMPLQPN